jgi:hypothetical protein
LGGMVLFHGRIIARFARTGKTEFQFTSPGASVRNHHGPGTPPLGGSVPATGRTWERLAAQPVPALLPPEGGVPLRHRVVVTAKMRPRSPATGPARTSGPGRRAGHW